MTKTIRNSEYCTGESKIKDGKIYFGCTEKLNLESEEVKQYYTCLLWDMDLKESCDTCFFKCINNKNPKMKEARKKKESLDKLIKKLEPDMFLYGITSDQVQNISDKYSKLDKSEDRDLGEQAIAAANIAQKTLSIALSGKPIDLAFFGLYAEQSSREINKLMRKKNKGKKSKGRVRKAKK
jgi:hypothetical protein